MKSILIILLLISPLWGMGKKPTEPCLSSEEKRVLKDVAQRELRIEKVWEDTAKMSPSTTLRTTKPRQHEEKPKPKITKQWIAQYDTLNLMGAKGKPTKPLLWDLIKEQDYAEKVIIKGYVEKHYYHESEAESLWTAFIKGQIKCSEPKLKRVPTLSLLFFCLIGGIVGYGIGRIVGKRDW